MLATVHQLILNLLQILSRVQLMRSIYLHRLQILGESQSRTSCRHGVSELQASDTTVVVSTLVAMCSNPTGHGIKVPSSFFQALRSCNITSACDTIHELQGQNLLMQTYSSNPNELIRNASRAYIQRRAVETMPFPKNSMKLSFMHSYRECTSLQQAQYCSVGINVSQFLPVHPLKVVFGICVSRHLSEDMVAAGFQHDYMVSDVVCSVATRSSDSKSGYGHQSWIQRMAPSLLYGNVLLVLCATAWDSYQHRVDKTVRDSKETPKKTVTNLTSILRCFSLFFSIPKLVSTHQGSTSIKSLNFVKFLGFVWVVHSHVHLITAGLVGYVYAAFDADTQTIIRQHTYNKYHELFTQNMSQMCVDVFLVVSGLLMCTGVVRKLETMEKDKPFSSLGDVMRRFPFGGMYLQRYLRLMPVYAYCMLMLMVFMPTAGSGPLWELDGWGRKQFEGCYSSGWRNLLFVNNLGSYEAGSSCMVWTWYLATDMQITIMCPFILLPLYWYGKVTRKAFSTRLAMTYLCSVVALFTALTFTISWTMNMCATLGWKRVGSDTIAFKEHYYVMPHTRISPFLVGVALAWLRFSNAAPTQISASTCGKLMLVAMTVVGILITWETGHTREGDAMFNATARTLFAVAVAIAVYLCECGYGGYFRLVVEHKVWVPLARVGYGAYLVHWAVIATEYGSQPTPMAPYMHPSAALSSCPVTVSVLRSCFWGAVIALLIEIPVNNILSMLLSPTNRTKSLKATE